MGSVFGCGASYRAYYRLGSATNGYTCYLRHLGVSYSKLHVRHCPRREGIRGRNREGYSKEVESKEETELSTGKKVGEKEKKFVPIYTQCVQKEIEADS